MTLRKELIELLKAGELRAGEISQALHIPEKEVYGHLEHVQCSLRGSFRMQPAMCLSCGFVFKKRKAVRCPGRCPLCKSEHIQQPVYSCDEK